MHIDVDKFYNLTS